MLPLLRFIFQRLPTRLLVMLLNMEWDAKVCARYTSGANKLRDIL